MHQKLRSAEQDGTYLVRNGIMMTFMELETVRKAICQKDDCLNIDNHSFPSSHVRLSAMKLGEDVFGTFPSVLYEFFINLDGEWELMVVTAGYSSLHQCTALDICPHFWLTAKMDGKFNCHIQLSGLLSAWWRVLSCMDFREEGMTQPWSKTLKT